MEIDLTKINLESFCKILNDSAKTTFILKHVKITKAERKKGLALVGQPAHVSGMITVVAAGEKREYHFEAADFEIYGD